IKGSSDGSGGGSNRDQLYICAINARQSNLHHHHCQPTSTALVPIDAGSVPLVFRPDWRCSSHYTAALKLSSVDGSGKSVCQDRIGACCQTQPLQRELESQALIKAKMCRSLNV
ncbi:unnamed protein product, partial [Ceratitis capitata]